MLTPISWLKDYINIKSDNKTLGLKLTEVGLGCEKIEKTKDGDIIFDLEITPNRPDLLSILGIAREIAAVENTKIKYPNLKTDLKPQKGAQILPLKIHPDFKITPRLTGIIINNVAVKDSPDWLKEKLGKLGQRPINNIVDITNFVMYELGNPIHSFDYHKIKRSEMWVKQAKGGEEFESVDEIKYHLPKGAIIYEDQDKIFDLVGIKGGKNSGTYKDTKAVLIVVEVDDPVLIRKASLALALRSDASAIFERNVNRGGTIDALKRTVDLILETAGGEIASDLIDLKEQEFNPWKLSLRLERLEFILGVKIPDTEVVNILGRLNLNPVILKKDEISRNGHPRPDRGSMGSRIRGNDNNGVIECSVPTYRNDLQIEEDLIEEVARIYGYNKFPKTLPIGEIPTKTIPYFKDYGIDKRVKNLLCAAGFSEIYTYSLISEDDLSIINFDSESALRIDTPVSREYEYLRPVLQPNLQKALDQNRANFSHVNLFELGKVYTGKTLDAYEEKYHLAGITNNKNFFEVKGILERIYNDLGIQDDPTGNIKLVNGDVYFEIDYTELLKKKNDEKIFIPVAKFPPVIEDMSIIAPGDTTTGDIIETIKKQSSLVLEVTLLDKYEETRTFHIVYQSRERNLKSAEIVEIRENILKSLKKTHQAKLKE